MNKVGTRRTDVALLIFLVFAKIYSDQADDNLITEISSVRPLVCDHGPITSNVALKHELRAGKFWRLGIAGDMSTCIRLCCEIDDCEMAYLPGTHCYGVDCFSEKHCEVTGIKPKVNMTVKIATVRPIVENSGAVKMFDVEDPSTKEELHCTQSPVLTNVTLRGGVKAGKFSDLGDVEGMHMCIALCCESRSCDLAFMIGSTCIAVDCYSEEMCQAVRARPTSYNPRISYIRKREFQRMGRKADTLPTKPRSSSVASPRQEIISARLPHRTILKTSRCSAVKIHHNLTLLGGIKSGNLTALGKTKNMQECIGKSCDLERGDLAFMLGNDCYSITCYSDRVCQTIPAKPSRFTPRLAFLKWSPKENETEALLEEHTTRKKIPHCTRSHILYNHTVLGGLRAGNFTKIAEVDSIETCAALCCAEKTCDLALMLGENCYAGDCASKELCKPIAAQQSSQIAYITSRKTHDNILDWSMWYLVVGTIAIILGVIGITWTACTCYSRSRKVKSSQEADRFGMMDEYGDSIHTMHMLPQEKYMTSGPLFLSETESDTDDEPEPQPIQKKSLPRQSLSNMVPFYTSPPPTYNNQPNIDPSRVRRSMQNL